MSETSPHDPATFAARALALGAEGLGAREIAVALGLSFAELDALVETDALFAKAMARAEEAARAWWEALPRQALEAGKPFNHAVWREAMRARFGEAEGGSGKAPPPRPRAIYLIPDNGRAAGPDGIPPCRYEGERARAWERERDRLWNEQRARYGLAPDDDEDSDWTEEIEDDLELEEEET